MTSRTPGRHPVADDRERGAAALGGVQQVPRHGVGVPGRGGDEDPQVGRGEQLRGQLAVAATTESTSGRVEQRQPGRHGRVRHQLQRPRATVDGRRRASPGSTRPSANQRSSPGAQSSTGARVVGRSTPAGLTGAPTSVFTSVDLPAPVDPPTTASSGASSRPSRGSR